VKTVNTVTLLFVVIHLIEDAALISLGRFLPLPAYVLYPVGLLASAVVMRIIVQNLLKHFASDVEQRH
jgi:hypothetical protein